MKNISLVAVVSAFTLYAPQVFGEEHKANDLRAYCARHSFRPAQIGKLMIADVTGYELTVIKKSDVIGRDLPTDKLLYRERLTPAQSNNHICSNRASLLNAELARLGEQAITLPLSVPLADSSDLGSFPANLYSAYCVRPAMFGDGFVEEQLGISGGVVIARTKDSPEETVEWEGVVYAHINTGTFVFDFGECVKTAKAMNDQLRSLDGKNFKLTYTQGDRDGKVSAALEEVK